jgi:single-strand DNA-binding protein
VTFSLNKVHLAGNLTRNPELKMLEGGRGVCSFGIAVNRRFKNAAGEAKEEATFVECTAWGKTGELVAQYLTKGSPAYVEGRLTQEEWTGTDGKKNRKTKVTVDNVQFLGSAPKRDETADAPAPAPSRPVAVAGDADEQPPF